MRLQFKNDIVLLKCSRCRKIFGISRNLFTYDVDCVSKRSMGEEYEHNLSWTGECSECKKKIYVDITAWEYPEECLNYCEKDISGATFHEDIELELIKD